MLVLPETAKEKPQQGNVLADGQGRRDEAGKRVDMDVKVGDTVLFARYTGSEIKLDRKKMLILKESDIQVTDWKLVMTRFKKASP